MTTQIHASAPTKVILTGEHVVVYGAPAIAVALDSRNSVDLFATDGNPELVVEGTIGRNSWEPGQEIHGTLFKAFLEMAKHIFKERKTDLATVGKRIRLVIHYGGMPKGCGNSASIASAAALALYKLLDYTPTRDELFHTVQVAEKIAHGAPSGIDARACSTGKAQRFQKSWNEKSEVSFQFKDASIQLPKGTTLLLVPSALPPHQAQSTTELVGLFAERKLGKKPAEATATDRQKIVSEFAPVFKAVSTHLHSSGNPLELADALKANHELLVKGGVVPPEMQQRIDWALEAGALAAKGTGACGQGGTILVLAYETSVRKIRNAMRKHGLTVLTPAFATKGASIDASD